MRTLIVVHLFPDFLVVTGCALGFSTQYVGCTGLVRGLYSRDTLMSYFLTLGQLGFGPYIVGSVMGRVKWFFTLSVIE